MSPSEPRETSVAGPGVGRPGAVVPLDEGQRAADEVGEGIGPGAGDDAAADEPSVDLDERGAVRHRLVLDEGAVRHRHRESPLARIPGRGRAHEARVALAVVEPAPVVDEQEPAILSSAVGAELHLVRVMESQALHRRHVDPGDADAHRPMLRPESAV